MRARGVVRAGIVKRVSAHTFRHSFATHLLQDGYTIQEPLGTVSRLIRRAAAAQR